MSRLRQVMFLKGEADSIRRMYVPKGQHRRKGEIGSSEGETVEEETGRQFNSINAGEQEFKN